MKHTIYKLYLEKNIFMKRHYTHMRSNLTNSSPTFLCSNCIGGLLFHDLGLQFRSPTVNLMIYSDDFVKFVLNLDDYLDGKFTFFQSKKYTCPCAYLEPFHGGDIITVHFTHYHSEQEAVDKWRERCQRINYNNLFIFLPERDNLTEEQLKSLAAVRAKGLLVFTANRYALPYTVQIPRFEKKGEVGDILARSGVTGQRKYEQYFDFVKWFNEANGGDFDVSRFQK